jgi:peptide/nickel transport system ATP-binding protein
MEERRVTMSNVLEVHELNTEFIGKKRNVKVLSNVNFFVKKGETLGIVGESGCGKSITSLSIMKLLGRNGKVTGKILFDGTDLLQMDEKEMRKIRGNQISMIFQDPMTSLNPVLTIGKQIGEVLRLHGNVSKADQKRKVVELIKQVGIPRAEEIYHEHPHRLSGGMRQRIMIAMAMACNPKLLIADEPTTALDVTIQAQMLDLMRELRKMAGMSLILITHDLAVVAEMCDRVMVMYAGEVVETANVRTLLRTPKHPYTQGLIQSTPHKMKDSNRLMTIPGNVPVSGEWGNGCRFAPRCSEAMKICFEKTPELSTMEDGAQCKCWLYNQ